MVLKQLIFLLASGLSVSCSLSVETDKVQCLVASDCAVLGYPKMICEDSVCRESEDKIFGCRNEVWPPPTGDLVDVAIEARDLRGDPVKGLLVKRCDTVLDPECENSAAESRTSEKGVATIPLPQGFRGHLFFPSLSDAQAAYIVQVNPPPNPLRPATLHDNITITNLKTIKDVAGLTGKAYVENRGHLFFTSLGCDQELMQDVRVSVVGQPDNVVIAYLGTNGLPDLNLTGTGTHGGGAILNLKPGFVTLRGFHDDVGKIFEQVILVKANTISITNVVPSPF